MSASGPGSGSGKEACVDGHHSKRPKYEEFSDRISSLPDDLKSQIVSRLPLRSALTTYILSRSWINIYSSLENLSFIESDFPNIPQRTHRLSALIDWTVANREGYGIRTLVIHLDHSYYSQCPWLFLKNAWIDFAVQNNIQFLSLMGEIDETGFASSLFTCRSLVVLRLMTPHHILKLPTRIFLPNIRTLGLYSVVFADDTLVEKLFTGCPLLNHLSIRGCSMSGLKRLKISCLKLNMLRISECTDLDKCIIDLQCTNMEYFYYDGVIARNIEFGNTESLKVAMLNAAVNLEDTRNIPELAPVALNLLRASRHAESLNISILFNQVLMDSWGGLRETVFFESLMSVRLVLWADEENEETVMTLLSKFTCVRKMEMVIYSLSRSRSPRPDHDRYSTNQSTPPQNREDPTMFGLKMHPENYHLGGILKHLEHLLMDNFEVFELEMGLLKFFLENAKSLTRITLRIPSVEVNLGGEYHSLAQFSEQMKKFITDDVRQLTDKYPNVSLTVLGMNETLN